MALTEGIKVGVGLIVPSVNRVTEQDWRWAWPRTVPQFVARARYSSGQDAARLLCEDALRAAADLAAARPSLGLFAYTAGGFHGATSVKAGLGERLARHMGCPVITAATAVVESLTAVGARTIAVVTPYEEADVERAVTFLSSNGFSVSHACGMGIADAELEADIEPAEILSYATNQVSAVAADAVLLSCTNWQAWSILPELERRLRSPVIASNQALVACALGRMDYPGLPAKEYGRLFEKFERST